MAIVGPPGTEYGVIDDSSAVLKLDGNADNSLVGRSALKSPVDRGVFASFGIQVHLFRLVVGVRIVQVHLVQARIGDDDLSVLPEKMIEDIGNVADVRFAQCDHVILPPQRVVLVPFGLQRIKACQQELVRLIEGRQRLFVPYVTA